MGSVKNRIGDSQLMSECLQCYKPLEIERMAKPPHTGGERRHCTGFTGSWIYPQAGGTRPRELERPKLGASAYTIEPQRPCGTCGDGGMLSWKNPCVSPCGA